MPGHRVDSGGSKYPVSRLDVGLVCVEEVPDVEGLLNQASRGKLPTQQEKNAWVQSRLFWESMFHLDQK